MTVKFLDLVGLHAPLQQELLSELKEVLENSSFILGPKVQAFEEAFAKYCGAKYARGVNSGTTALHMALLAMGIGPGDEVIVPAMTFVATAEAVRYCGATPVFADIDPARYTLSPHAIEAALTSRTKAIIPVHLYGLMADMPAICAIAQKHGLKVLEDAAQAHGAELDGKRAGQWGDAACFSFYPGKNLGACGEGGAIVTNDPKIDEQVRILRDWGQEGKYNHVRQGFNARMDGFQGAMLGVKLKYIEEWTEARRALAARYNELFADIPEVTVQASPDDCRHVYHVYAVSMDNRDAFQHALSEAGIQTGIHYPHAIPHLESFKIMGYRMGDFPASENLGKRELSLPMCPTHSPDTADIVASKLRRILQG